ncbi:MAG: YwiC-like family protein [Chloroflexi bacterium]|nr:YwiC-like family protein [Chloroflexota bacterium]
MIPKEHGGWAMLLVPYIIGLGVAARVGLASLLFLLSILLVFLASEPLSVLVKSFRLRDNGPRRGSALRWLLAYLFLAGLATAPVVVIYGRWWLVLFGVLGLGFLGLQGLVECKRVDRTTIGEVVGALGLSLSAPGVYYATLGDLGATAFLLWLLSALHSTGSVLYVNLRLRQFKARGECPGIGARLALGRETLLYVAMLVAVLIGLAYFGQMPILALVAYLPLVGKALRAFYRISPAFSFKRLGYVELASALFFAIMLVLSYSVS